MTVWKEFEGWTYEYFDRDIEPAALPGFEDLVRLWQEKRGDRVVPSWSDFDFYDFKDWHGRISVYDISYDPFDYTSRLSGTVFDGVYQQTMTGTKGSELAERRVESPVNLEFYELTCRRMLVSRTSGSFDFEDRDQIQVSFVEFPLSDGGPRATHTLEAMIGRGGA
jgi:hypothetical protein